jgi:hypothetical protein
VGGISSASPPSEPPKVVSDAHSALSDGAIVGISIACILVCAVIAIGLFTFRRRKSPEANHVTAEGERSDSNSTSALGSEMLLTMPEPGTQSSDIEASEDEETEDISNNTAYRAYLLEFNKHLVSVKDQVQRKGHRRNRSKNDNSDLQYFLTEASLRNATRGTADELSDTEHNGEVSEITSPIFSEDETLDTVRGTCDEDERQASTPIIASSESIFTPEPEKLSKQRIEPKLKQETPQELESVAEQAEFPVPILQLRMPVERTRARTFVFDNLSDVSLERPSDVLSSRRSKSHSEVSKVSNHPQPQVLLVTPKYAPPPVPSGLEQSRQLGHLQDRNKVVEGSAQGTDRREPHSGTLQAPKYSKSLSLTGTKKRAATFNTAMSLRTEKPKDAKES